MFVPEPVVSLSLKPQGQESPNFSRALNRFTKEDPTFRVHVDSESKEVSICSPPILTDKPPINETSPSQTIISGMGELHLEVYVERMKREYNVDCTTGRPRVNYRETITQRADFSYLHKKQSGGAGQYAKVTGFIEPISAE